MSFWQQPTVAAKMQVAAPTQVTVCIAVADCSNIGDSRQTMNTPAVTIVAAWIRALTGVGPSIASGSQVWSGICADFANAPTSSSTQPATRSPLLGALPNAPASVAWKAFRNSSDPVCLKMKYVPSTSPTSPTTLITNA